MKKLVLSLLFVVCAMGSGYLVMNELYTFAIILTTLTVLVLLMLLGSVFEKRTPETIYNRELRDLIKTYEAILVDIDKLPEFDVKNIIKVSNFEKLVDVQYELKKPIFYKMSINSCSFIIMDSEIAYVYVLRVNENSFSPLDDIMSSIEDSNVKRRKDKKLLEEIDKTTIIKVNENREYKVSPIRKMDLTEEGNTAVSNENEEPKIEVPESTGVLPVVNNKNLVEEAKEEVIAELEVEEPKNEEVLKETNDEVTLEVQGDAIEMDDLIKIGEEEQTTEEVMRDCAQDDIELPPEREVEEKEIFYDEAIQEDFEEESQETFEEGLNELVQEAKVNDKKKQQYNKYKKNYANMRASRIYKNQSNRVNNSNKNQTVKPQQNKNSKKYKKR